ncbi:3722_t:CDS:2, partial [Cetraspora pellucida]
FYNTSPECYPINNTSPECYPNNDSYGFDGLGNLNDNVPQEHMNNAVLIDECLKEESKIFHRLNRIALLERQNITSSMLNGKNGHLKNLLMTLKLQSSKLEEEPIDLESFPMDQLF